ncbi:BrnT family toxin [Microcoleus sp. A003_D6]|uniref:BrnT family toxin n=1 Tax=Microcoleus sp. A003_D6 TaxID=3055266 RepID=UPI003FA574EB
MGILPALNIQIKCTTAYEQLLIVAHTDRGEKVRIISARKATRQEQKFYEEG